MNTSKWLGITLAATLGLGAVASRYSAQAVELSDGRVYFEQPPSLVEATSTRNVVAASGGMYYFTINVPENSGEPLQRVAFAQRDGDSATRRVRFDLEDSRAFVGTRGSRGEAIAISNVTFDDETRTVSVNFAQPVAPGTTVTVGLEPVRNPRLGGVYLFGVTAYPRGDSAYGQFLGYGRFQFYERGGDLFPSIFRRERYRHSNW
ncbi:DUF2808 domain-containing protein [Oculatella sp. LEGE 06141]|uniref:DUF2808 domain-containing protein n=1 Tax=Oculatella sp. LEGE 06141 TaxID=1828648 RepID=UPI00187ECCEF|nr:DUF2808 domain-containing protein [Oculatella sp. LEGE 06141]MBE9177528.1 DUF2808 domain-containing protein [Oculatella sp. LEGE 06141]